MDTKLLIIVADGPADCYQFDGLEESGFALTFASSLAEAVRSVIASKPDALLLVVDPRDAYEFCEVLRALGDLPLVITSTAMSSDVAAQCLDAGADAVISASISVRELGARIGAVCRRALRRVATGAGRVVVADGVCIDLDARAVWRNGVEVNLAPTEFKMLSVLAESPGRVVSNGELLSRVWGEEYTNDVHYVRLYIGYLRGKLEDDARTPRLILNQWGVGYRLVAQVVASAEGGGGERWDVGTAQRS